jgi:electron transfer flavoprotein beta subunit
MKAKKKEIKTFTPADLEVTITPKVLIKKMAEPPKRKGGRIVADVSELVRTLKEEARVI